MASLVLAAVVLNVAGILGTTTVICLERRIGGRSIRVVTVPQRPRSATSSFGSRSERTGGEMRALRVFGERAVVEMSVDEACAMLGVDDLADAKPAAVIEAVERDIERIRRRDPELADSALAASAVAMAYEIALPFNSATSKSMCQARLAETLGTLRELMPPEQKRDKIDEIAARRADRLAARGTATANLPCA